MTLKPVLCGVVLALFAQFANADSYRPSPSCTKPDKPYQFTSKYEVENFNIAVEQYKRCIQEFVEEQQRAVTVHRNAAAEAIEEWNSYVRYELNR